MIVVSAHNALTPLGADSAATFAAVESGETALALREGLFGLPEPFVGGIIDRDALDARFEPLASPARYTALEKAMILAVDGAVRGKRIDLTSLRTRFVVSTTKGNVELLEDLRGFGGERLLLWHTAAVVAKFFGNSAAPTVVSNACISGACALLAAKRLLESDAADTVVVVGGDVLSRFIVSGFQSFKALSSAECRPFDSARSGLNLGEAAAVMVLERKEHTQRGDVVLESGAIRNDANHISGPSRTGEGLYNALTATLGEVRPDELSFVNAHGTATMYNDEMESIALHRAAADTVAVNSLKGYFGHTLGAAGVLESIVSVMALERGEVLASRGFENLGVSCPIAVVRQTMQSAKYRFVKMLSGFGGSNAAVMFRLEQ